MLSCICTPNIVSVNTDVSFMTWRCEVHIWTRGCLAGLYDIKAVFIIILNVLIFQNTLGHLNSQPFPHSGILFLQKLPLSWEGWWRLIDVLKFRTAVSQNPCYCTATTFQFRCLLVPKSAIFNPYMGMMCNRATS
jgi:hypothetical protein